MHLLRIVNVCLISIAGKKILSYANSTRAGSNGQVLSREINYLLPAQVFTLIVSKIGWSAYYAPNASRSTL